MKKGFFKKCVVFIILLEILLTFPIISYAYANQYPDYLGFRDCAYLEINTNLGVGSLVIPKEFQYNYISVYQDVYISNIGNSTISGLFITDSGTVYNVRIQSLGVLQYRYTNGYITEYRDIRFSEIKNTNININNVGATSEDLVYHFSTYEILVIVLLCFNLLIRFLQFIYTRVKNG